jgi:hypothetical protein
MFGTLTSNCEFGVKALRACEFDGVDLSDVRSPRMVAVGSGDYGVPGRGIHMAMLLLLTVTTVRSGF